MFKTPKAKNLLEKMPAKTDNIKAMLTRFAAFLFEEQPRCLMLNP